MLTWFKNRWDALSSTFWFIPALMLVASALLSVLTLHLDASYKANVLRNLSWIAVIDASGALSILSTLAASMMTVAGTVFSITIVGLTLSASQFGQLLLRNFMQDKGNQFVLGAFLSTFLYALFIMRSIQGADDVESFVPYLSIACTIGMAILCVCVLIYFIHHVARSIQVEHVVADIGRKLKQSIDQLAGDSDHGGASSDRADLPLTQPQIDIRADCSANLQSINYSGLMDKACAQSLVIQLKVHPGLFLTPHTLVATVYSQSPLIDEAQAALISAIHDELHIGDVTTSIQDISHHIRQLVQIAVRALSPGVNDPLTAYLCISHLQSALEWMVNMDFPSGARYDEHGVLRLSYPMLSFDDLLSVSLDELMTYAAPAAVVSDKVLAMIKGVIEASTRDSERLLLADKARSMIALFRQATGDEETAQDMLMRLEGPDHAD